MSFSTNQNFEESLEEELAKKIDPEMLEYLDQLLAENVPAVRKIVKNVLEEEPIPREMEKYKPLEPKPYPLRQRKTRNMRELLREFEPSP